MRRRRIGLFALVVVLVGSWVAPASAQEWEEAYPGVRYLSETRAGPVQVHAVEVDLCATGVNLRATRGDESPKVTSAFGESIGAEVVVNGDFFEPNYDPVGFAMGDGELWAEDIPGHGFVAAGVGGVEIMSPLDRVATPQEWMTEGVGGYNLVLKNGVATADSGDFCTTRHPRTAAGLSADGTRLYLAVADGRSDSSVGMTCGELGRLMAELGAEDALNLDGGGSTAMWRSDLGVVNVPSDGEERTVSNHLAVHADGESAPRSCPRFGDGTPGGE